MVVAMTESEDYCALCDLPRSQCVHGQPPAVAEPVAKAPPRPRASARSRTPGATATPVTRRWTPPEAFKPLIVGVLREAGGELDADELFLELESVADDQTAAGGPREDTGGRAALAVRRTPCASGTDQRGPDDAGRSGCLAAEGAGTRPGLTPAAVDGPRAEPGASKTAASGTDVA